jgi:hypothetical protein
MSTAPNLLTCAYVVSRFKLHISTLTPLRKFKYMARRAVQSNKLNIEINLMFAHHHTLPLGSQVIAENLKRILLFIIDRYEIFMHKVNPPAFNRVLLNKMKELSFTNQIEDKTEIYDMLRRIGVTCNIWLPDKNRYCCNNVGKQRTYMCKMHSNREQYIIAIVQTYCPLNKELINIVAEYSNLCKPLC